MPAQPKPRRRWRDGIGESPTPKVFPAYHSPAALLAARELGCQPKTASHYLAKVKHIAAACVRALRRTGDIDGLELFLRPIREAEQGAPREVTDEMIEDEQTVDAREDECEVASLLDPADPVKRDSWERQLRKSAARSLALADALRAKGAA